LVKQRFWIDLKFIKEACALHVLHVIPSLIKNTSAWNPQDCLVLLVQTRLLYLLKFPLNLIHGVCTGCVTYLTKCRKRCTWHSNTLIIVLEFFLLKLGNLYSFCRWGQYYWR
jgi:hypothetical protein